MRKLSFLCILLSCLLIWGCGSGGGGNNQISNTGSSDKEPNDPSPNTEQINAKPVAVIKGDTNDKPGQLIEISGSDSYDADVNLLTYKWSLLFTPNGSKASLSSTNTPNISVTPDLDGLYRIQLIVNDGTVDSDPKIIEIIVSTPNSAPMANAGPDQNINTGFDVKLDGSASSDPDGDTLTYQWAFVSLPNGSKALLSNVSNKTAYFAPDMDGDYVIQLIVSDGEIESTPDEVKIIASTPNAIPIAKAGTDRFILFGDTIILNGGESTDANQDPLSFRWFFVSKPEGSNASIEDAVTVNPQLMPDIPGTYVVGLVVNDGLADSSQDNVTIQAFSEPLLATIYVNPTNIFYENGLIIRGGDGSVITSGVLQANGKVYGDLRNQIDYRTYEVTAIMFLDSNRQVVVLSSDPQVLNNNNIDTLETISVNYTTPINADVRGWIVLWQYKDENGDILSLESRPLVYDWETADNSLPVANADPDQTVSVGSLVTLNGSSSSDPDGDNLFYKWSFVSIPAESSVTLSDANAVNPTFTADVEGTYIISLIVNDGKADSASDSITVQAGPPTVTSFELPAGENALYLLRSSFGGPSEYADLTIVDFSHKGTPLSIFSISATAAATGDVFSTGNKSLIFTTTDSISFGSGSITYTGRVSFSGYTSINNEDFKIATVVNFENSNSAFVHFSNMGNGIYRVEVDVYDVFGGTDGIDPYQDYDDLVFLIGPRSNIESFLGFALQ